MSARRGSGDRAAGDPRGSSYDRRRRRERIVEEFGVGAARDPSRKVWVYCHHCPRRMRASGHAWEVDRFPVCGHDGGRYTWGNVVPSCKPCNGTRCGVRGAACRGSGKNRRERRRPVAAVLAPRRQRFA